MHRNSTFARGQSDAWLADIPGNDLQYCAHAREHELARHDAALRVDIAGSAPRSRASAQQQHIQMDGAGLLEGLAAWLAAFARQRA